MPAELVSRQHRLPVAVRRLVAHRPVPGSAWRRRRRPRRLAAASSCCATTPMRRRAPATRWSTARCSAGCSPTSTATCGSSGCRAGFDDLRAALAAPGPRRPTEPADRRPHARHRSPELLRAHVPRQPPRLPPRRRRRPGRARRSGLAAGARRARARRRGAAPGRGRRTPTRSSWATRAQAACRAPGPGGPRGRASGWPTRSAAAWPATSPSRPTCRRPAQALLGEASPAARRCRRCGCGDADQRADALAQLDDDRAPRHGSAASGGRRCSPAGSATTERASLARRHRRRARAASWPRPRLELATDARAASGGRSARARWWCARWWWRPGALGAPAGACSPAASAASSTRRPPVLAQRRGTAKDVWVLAGDRARPAVDVVGRPAGRAPGRPAHVAAEPRRRGAVLGRSQRRAGRGDRPPRGRARAAVRAVAGAGRAGRAVRGSTRSLAGLRAVSGGAPAEEPSRRPGDRAGGGGPAPRAGRGPRRPARRAGRQPRRTWPARPARSGSTCPPGRGGWSGRSTPAASAWPPTRQGRPVRGGRVAPRRRARR